MRDFSVVCTVLVRHPFTMLKEKRIPVHMLRLFHQRFGLTTYPVDRHPAASSLQACSHAARPFWSMADPRSHGVICELPLRQRLTVRPCSGILLSDSMVPVYCLDEADTGHMFWHEQRYFLQSVGVTKRVGFSKDENRRISLLITFPELRNTDLNQLTFSTGRSDNQVAPPTSIMNSDPTLSDS